MTEQLVDHPPLLQLVHLDHRVEQLEVVAGVPGEHLERLDVLGKARAPVADAGPQERGADALVEAHAAGHLADVGADLLADIGDLVDERDLGCQEGVGGELDHLGASDIRADDLAAERLVDRGHRVARGLVARVGTDHNPIGVHEVGDRRALLEELGARDVGEVAEVAPDRLAGAGRHGALHHQHVVAVGAQLLDDRAHSREIGVAGAGRRRVDADEEDAGCVEQLVHVGGEGEALGVAGQQVGQARLVDRGLPARKRFHLLGDDVAGHDRVAELCEARGRDEAYPSDPDYADRLSLSTHSCPLLRFGFLFGILTLAERAIPTIWSLVSTRKRLFDTQ